MQNFCVLKLYLVAFGHFFTMEGVFIREAFIRINMVSHFMSKNGNTCILEMPKSINKVHLS